MKIIIFLLSFSFGFMLLAQDTHAADVWKEYVNDSRLAESWTSMNIFALDSSDVPHVLYYDQDGQVFVDQYRNGTWTSLPSLGNGVGSTALSLVLDTNDDIYVSYLSGADDAQYGDPLTIVVKKFDGTAWQVVGGMGEVVLYRTTKPQSMNMAINDDGELYLVFADTSQDDRGSVLRYDGLAWNVAGTQGFTGGGILWPSIAFDSSQKPYLAYLDEGAGDKVTLQSFQDDRWSIEGDRGFSNEDTYFLSPLRSDSAGSIYLQYSDLSTDEAEGIITSQISILQYDGTALRPVGRYVQQGADIDEIAFFGSFALDSLDQPYIAFASTDGVTVARLIDNAWEILGGKQGIDNVSIITPIALTTDDEPLIVTTITDDSYSEKIAVQKLVKNALCRFYSATYQGHFYTDSTQECAIVKKDPYWNYEGIAYTTLQSTSPGATPVYRFWSPVYNHHFYTISSFEKDQLIANDPNWDYEGVGYYVYAKSTGDTQEVYRFWSDTFKAHFYTTSTVEKDQLTLNDPNWVYEGIAWHVNSQ